MERRVTGGAGDAFPVTVLPFSKRPPAPEEYLLRSGDFEAVTPAPQPWGQPQAAHGHAPQQAHAQQAPHAQMMPPPSQLSMSMSGSHGGSYVGQPIPTAPRAPIFARQAAATPYGFMRNYGSDLNNVPPPPHSLAPMAMTHDHSYSTNSQRFAPPASPSADKPSLKWGVMIALTGAVLGGVLGIGMDAHKQSKASASTAMMAQDAPAAAAQPASQPAARPATQMAAVAPAKAALPAIQAAQPMPAAQPVAGGVILPAQPPVVIAPAPVPAAPVAATPVRDAKAEKAEKAEAAKAEKEAKKHGAAHASHGFARPQPHANMLSTKVKAPEPEPEVAPAPKPEPKKAPVAEAKPAPEKKTAAAPEPKAEKADKADKGKKTDAQQVLEDAIKNTANTL